MTAPPGDRLNPLPRRAARVLLVDADDRVLMFRGTDPGRPGERYWFTVGGGLDDGESAVQAAARELREETGLEVSDQSVGEPVWHEVTDFPYGDTWYRQDQDFFLVRVDSWEVSTLGHDVVERESIDAHRWWSVEELVETAERFYPAVLPSLLREILGL
jgi:8-oxo-dGTP pyrophosphatase MutT (NUDIX family)